MADISKITLPSGNTYNIKDTVARQMISGGVSFIIAWNGTSAPVVADIPSGVKVTYNDTVYTGTLAATEDTVGSFYLVKSSTTPSGEALDIYDEYVTVSRGGNPVIYFWEKLGDTKVDLSDVVTNVTLNKKIDSVIGADSTFSITQPTVTLSSESTASTGSVSVVSDITSASVSGDDVSAITDLGTPSTASVIGKDATFTVTQPTISMSLTESAETGKVNVVTDVNATITNIKAQANNGATAWDSKDEKEVITGYAPDIDDFLQDITTTTRKLVTTTITGVTGTNTTASKVTTDMQTTAIGTGTASTLNTEWLRGVSVNDETLVIGSATMDSQTTCSVRNVTDVDVPITAATATQVATGAVATTDANGATVVTSVAKGTHKSAVTSLGTPTTASVVGSGSTFSVTQPTVSLTTGATAGTGVISVATGVSGTTKYIGGTATNGDVAWGNQKNVSAVTGYSSPTKDNVLGAESTITVTPSKTNIKATASGVNVEWDNKDTVTVLTSATDVQVTNGN